MAGVSDPTTQLDSVIADHDRRLKVLEADLASRKQQPAPAPTPTPTPTPTPAPAPTGQTLGQRYGAISFPLEQSQADTGFINRQMDIIKDLGMGWVRSDFPPSMISPSKGVYNWDGPARWVRSALERGLKPLPILYILPGWMNGGGNDKIPPRSDDEYAEWCAAAAKWLAAQGVTAVEVWNEQNLGGFWAGQPRTDDAYRGKYSRMLAKVYPAVKAVAPNMIVVSGGLSTADDLAGQPDPPGHGCLATVQRYADLGVFKNCDAFGWHPYLDTDTPCKDVDVWPSFSPKAFKAVLDIIDKAAPGRGISIWTTETGCPRTAVGGNQGEQSNRAQALWKAYLPGGCLNQYANRMGPSFWFCSVDRATGDGREDGFGFQSKSGQNYQMYADVKKVLATPWPG